MTNTQLEAFLTLCRYGNITQAAEHLFITQPALSRLIKSLESELGYTLFRRGKGQRQAVLTEEGQRFRAIAVDMNRLYRQAKSQETTKVRSMLRISATPALYSSFLPDAYIRFRRARPDVDVELDAVHSMEAYRQLVQGQADLVLVNSHIVEPSVVSVPLFSERVVLLCSKGLYPEGAIHPSQLDRSLSISTGWSPDFQAWFEYWFGKTLSASYLRIKIGSMVEYFGNLQDFWIVIPESSAEHIQKTQVQMFICWLMHRRIVFAMPCICTTKKAAPEMICCQLYARACRQCQKSRFYSLSHNHFIACICKIVKC